MWRQGWRVALPLSFLVYAVVDPFQPAWACSQIGCFSGNDFYALGVLLGYGYGAFVNPDADQVGVTHAEGLMINKIPILGHVLFGYWSIYGSIFRKRHRSLWTHTPIISTIIRFLYQFAPLFLIIFLNQWNYPIIFQVLFGWLIGQVYSDFLHWREDKRSEKRSSKYHRTLSFI